jgi:hypothetical protein
MTIDTQEALEQRLANLDQTGLELLTARSPDSLIKRIVEVACRQVNAGYTFMTVKGDEENPEQVIPYGISKKELLKVLQNDFIKVFIKELEGSDFPERLQIPKGDKTVARIQPGIFSLLGTVVRVGGKNLGVILCVNSALTMKKCWQHWLLMPARRSRTRGFMRTWFRAGKNWNGATRTWRSSTSWRLH